MPEEIRDEPEDLTEPGPYIPDEDDRDDDWDDDDDEEDEDDEDE
jgi:hypothetical protein